jgi:phospho-N-acetylmuramoyl-pentapeptide-transferase
MLYWLTGLSDGGDLFNLFRYITFRAGGAFLTALVFGFLFGKPLINVLRKRQGKGQPIRDDGPEGHFVKAGTPTMGGLLIVGALLTSTLLWARLDNAFVWMVLFVTISYAAIGFADDYSKVKKQNTAGVSGKVRLLLGFLIAGIAGAWAAYFHPAELTGQLAFPVFKDALLNLGIFFVPFSMIVIVGAANAVNLTDGLDGLAIMPVMIAGGALGIIAYAVGRTDFTEYLDVHYVPGTGEIFIFTAALIGGGLGFLWYNAPPAAVFMGDTGSLALGGALGGDRGRHQARDRAGHRRRSLRGRGALGDHPGALLQAHRQARVPDGADPPPLREEGLGGAADRHSLLDHLADPRADRPRHAQGALTARRGLTAAQVKSPLRAPRLWPA